MLNAVNDSYDGRKRPMIVDMRLSGMCTKFHRLNQNMAPADKVHHRPLARHSVYFLQGCHGGTHQIRTVNDIRREKNISILHTCSLLATYTRIYRLYISW